MISLDTRSFSPRLSGLSYPAISANACLVTLILSHVSFISFLALKHLHELAILAMRTHVCRALVRVCTYSFFSIVHYLKYPCFVLLCQRTQMHALAVRTHTRVRASACRRVCVHFFSPERLLLLFIYAGISLICSDGEYDRLATVIRRIRGATVIRRCITVACRQYLQPYLQWLQNNVPLHTYLYISLGGHTFT